MKKRTRRQPSYTAPNIRRVKKNEKRKKLLRLSVISIIVIIVGYWFLFSPRGTINWVRYYHQKSQLKNEIRRLETDINQLKEEKEKLVSDPEYIEKIAREKYNMKKKGEKVYKIVPK